MSAQAGKYARFELERRFLVEHLSERKAQDQGWHITDRYVQEHAPAAAQDGTTRGRLRPSSNSGKKTCHRRPTSHG